MKKLLLIALLIVGCSSPTDNENNQTNCVIRGSNTLQTRYECYENIYTQSDCIDKVNQVGDITLQYFEYITEPCSEFCEAYETSVSICYEY